MEKKTILAACAAATLAFTGCSGGFSAAEEETIHAGKGEIMRILTVGNPADSLVLRQKAAPVTGRMLRTDDYAVLRRRMLATVQDPQNSGVGIAAPQVGILRQKLNIARTHLHDLLPGVPFIGRQELGLPGMPLGVDIVDDGGNELLPVPKVLIGRAAGHPAQLGDPPHGKPGHPVAVDLLHPGLDELFPGVAAPGFWLPVSYTHLTLPTTERV